MTDQLDSMRDAEALIASLRQRNQELQISEARSRAMLRTMLDGVVHIDARGTILLVNDTVLKMFGYEADELIGRNVSMLVPEPHRSAHDGYLERYLMTRVPRIVGNRREVQGQRKDGTLVPMDLMINEMVDDTGSTFIGLLRDISDYKATMRVLEDALSIAESASKSRSRFLANMSHEIRTPINAVLGFSQLCLRGVEMPPRGRDYVEKIHQAAESLLGVVNDILDFSKIEAGKLTMEHIPFSLDEVLQRLAGLFSLKAREKGLEFAIGALPGTPRQIVGDPLRLGQVLTNLVGNAIKFTDHGEIVVLVEPSGVQDKIITLRFTVQDSGLGMTEAQQASLFTAFNQADSSTTRRFGGTGLGLAISRQLVERMGGGIEVRSVPARGSTFSFTARFGVAEETLPAKARLPLAGKRVLVVEDNAIMRTLLSQCLTVLGCEASGADSGEEALRLASGATGFDAILMDWRLPGMDGLACARQLRARRIPTPILLITGDEPEAARSKATAGDIQAFLAKPVDRSRLSETLANLFAGRGELPRAAEAEAQVPNLSGRRLLLVDDNDFNRQVGSELVELTGADVRTADDGEQAVVACENTRFDLVLMDLQMPVMDGYTAALILRERYPDMPILALTAHALVEERQRVLQAGMNDILTKPIRPELLYGALARWLGGAAPESESEPESEMAGPAPEATPRVETPPAEVMDAEAVAPDAMAAEAMAPDVLDVEAGMRTANGDAGFYARMLQRFETSPATDLDALASLIDAGDSATAHRQAHSLKGMCASIGATRLHTLMRDIELALKEEKANVAQALLPAARAGLAALRECVARYSMG